MYEITKNEELILLAILRLTDNAYGVTIRKNVMDVTKKEIHYGSLYNTLDLLIRKGYVIAKESDPESVRGGRRKKLYCLSADGIKALKEAQELQRSAWDGIPELGIEQVK